MVCVLYAEHRAAVYHHKDGKFSSDSATNLFVDASLIKRRYDPELLGRCWTRQAVLIYYCLTCVSVL